MSPSERQRLVAISASLGKKGFRADAELIDEIGAAWDQMDQFVVVHRAAIAGAPDPDGEIVTEQRRPRPPGPGTEGPPLSPDAAQSSAGTTDANGRDSTRGATSRPEGAAA
ncbi:MAG: hypothetical protein M3340_12115 [Actinomycetota bacterium]|nr:hypothetical protein [Actinomycetota bacterium]